MARYGSGLSDPAYFARAVTPGTTALADGVTRGLYVGGAGNVNVTMGDGNDVLFTGVAAGTVLPIRVSHVLATSTTATTITALY